MFRVTFLIAVSMATAIWGSQINEEEFMKTCGKLLKGHTHQCCKLHKPIPKPENLEEIMKECGELPSTPPACDRDICIANKKGYASPDGTLDKAKQIEMIEKDFSDFPPAFVTAVKEKCINGDPFTLGAADECEVMKFGRCVQMQMIVNCPKWDNNGPCEGLEEAATECAKLLQ